jgi:hypothetical protein
LRLRECFCHSVSVLLLFVIVYQKSL